MNDLIAVPAMTVETEKLIPRAWKAFDRLSRWPLIQVESTGQMFLQIEDAAIVPGLQWIAVAEVSAEYSEMLLNRPALGIGEAVATVAADEARYALVRMRDGRDAQALITSLAIQVTVLVVPFSLSRARLT